MLYRETGQYKASYEADQQIFPITQDKYLFWGFMVFLLVVPTIYGSGSYGKSSDLWVGARSHPAFWGSYHISLRLGASHFLYNLFIGIKLLTIEYSLESFPFELSFSYGKNSLNWIVVWAIWWIEYIWYGQLVHPFFH